MKTKAWHRTMSTWIGLLFFAIGINDIKNHETSVLWLIATAIVYFSFTIAVTVGYHRLFTHKMFSCKKVWHWIFGIVGCISMSTSPATWGLVHIAHHVHADTPQDPYYKNWKYFFHIRDRNNIKVTSSTFRLLKDPMHRLLKDYSLSIALLYLIVTFTIGINCFIFAAAAPIGLFMFAGGLHTIYSHSKLEPRNQWVMEFLVPLSGEWIHKEHHNFPRLYKWNTKAQYFDVGGVFINLIKNPV